MPCAAWAAGWVKAATILAIFFNIIFEASNHITKALVSHARRLKSDSALCFSFCVLFASGSETSCGELNKASHQLNRIIVARQDPFHAGEVRRQRGARIIAEGKTRRGRSPGKRLAEKHFYVQFF